MRARAAFASSPTNVAGGSSARAEATIADIAPIVVHATSPATKPTYRSFFNDRLISFLHHNRRDANRAILHLGAGCYRTVLTGVAIPAFRSETEVYSRAAAARY